MSSNRAWYESGWVQLACPDTIRGVWIRVTDTAIELCGGRDGDDLYTCLRVGDVVAEEHRKAVVELLQVLEFSHESVSGAISDKLFETGALPYNEPEKAPKK